MALIKCKECGKDISDTAKICINCGAKTEKAKLVNKKIKLYGIISIIIILIVCGIILIYNNNDVVKSKNKAISLLQKYKKDEITTEKLINELEQLSDNTKLLANKESSLSKSAKLNLLSSILTTIDWEITSKYLSWNSHEGTSDIKINEYIKKIKDL